MDDIASARSPAVLRNTSALALDTERMARALAEAQSPGDVREIERRLEFLEKEMNDSGLYTQDQVREVNELRMRARWRLGTMLAAIDRQKVIGPGRGHVGGKTIQTESESFMALLKRLNLEHETAVKAQRIGKLPEDELEKALAEAHRKEFVPSFAFLIERARPYWYAASRERRHQAIFEGATSTAGDTDIGPFPLIYADPPWRFEIYSPKGLERTPDQHYPTLSDDEIAYFKIGDRTIPDLAFKDAALLLWCTSSNLERALDIMEAWDFTFKTSAVWVKDRSGLGLVFRNQHELLLYGTRGKMPGPAYQPSSVFMYARGRHSAKPPEIRAEIELMYPHFDATTRLELFAREPADGWTCRGFEAMP